MVRALYTAYTGMVNEQKRLDVISNNVANASTVGYKTERATSQSFKEELTYKIKDASVAYNRENIGNMSLGTKIGEVYTDYSQGSLRETGNTYDLAIEGKGFFQVAHTDSNGNTTTRYTRDGSFTMTKDGDIVDADGNKLLGVNGAIRVPVDAKEISIANDGVIYADDTYIDTIQLTDFQDYDFLEHFGDNMYGAVQGATQIPTDAIIDQGYTEQSNVNTVSEMVDMIAVTRAYEAGQKMIKTVDGMLDAAVNSVGSVNG